MLERVESPRSRHTAVGLRGAIGGQICCQQSSERTNRRLNPVLEKGVVARISAHSGSVGLRGGALPETI